MDLQQPTGSVAPNPTEPQLNDTPRSWWSRHRWFIPVAAAVLVVGGLAGSSLTLWLTKTKAPSAGSSQTATTTAAAAPAEAPKASATRWKGTVSPTAIPLGDGKVSTAAKVGYIDSCATNFRGGGARHAGSWINEASNTWDSETKTAVEGTVRWPTARYSAAVSGTSRVVATNDLPGIYPTGMFPIARTDPAYQYDTNPNAIGAQMLTYRLPLNPTAAGTPGCLPLGPIGILTDGVVIFDALDDAGRDAVAHETQDLCSGHPNSQEIYHYHNVPTCLRDKATGSATLVGYAFDGYGIYVERDSKGNLPTDADLDACHGRTSQVLWNGKQTTIYHYDATLEYPYTVGCFHGTPAVMSSGRPQPRP